MRVLLVALLLLLAACSSDEPADGPEGDDVLDTVFVGDSLSAGVDPTTFEESDRYSWVRYVLTDPRTPWRLQANASLFGRTLGEMQVALQDEVLRLDPEAVVILGGTNDALRQLPPETSAAALRTMVVQAQETGAEVWVVGPPPLDPAYQRDVQPYVDAERAVAEEMDVPFVDVSRELAGPDGNWLPGLSSDGVHTSEEGARRLADLVLDELGR